MASCRTVGAIGRRFIVYLDEDGRYCIYDKKNCEFMNKEEVDQERTKKILELDMDDAKKIMKEL